MKRILTAIPLAPLSYMVYRVLDLYSRAWEMRMRLTDPLFPQTLAHVLQKACVDLFASFVPFLLMVLSIQFIFSRAWGYFVERERVHYEAESRK